MAASFSAFQLGFLPWRVKWCQASVWDKKVTRIQEVDGLLEEIDLALPALADRITRHQRSELAKLHKRIRVRHECIGAENVRYFHSLVIVEEDKNRFRARYHEYLADETNHIFKEWQKEDYRALRDMLATMVPADRRLRGYYEIGDHLGEALDRPGPTSPSISKKAHAYVLAGMNKLPLREQREVAHIFVPTATNMLALFKQVKNLGRFVQTLEDYLIAKPHWDGKTFTYRAEAVEVKIQTNSVMACILDEGEKQGWPDAIKLSPKQIGNRRSAANAINYFETVHKLMEFSLNRDRVIWGAPGTIKPRRKTRSV
jgi:hypothetical protein